MIVSMDNIAEKTEGLACADCGRVVVTHARTGHDRRICGGCAREKGVCRWCGVPAKESTFGYHCIEEDDYYAIGSAGGPDDGVIY